MEIIKILAGLPIWLILLPIRFCIGLLNLIRCKKIKVFEETSFLKYSRNGMGSVPIRHPTFSSKKLGWGHLIICYIRGMVVNKKIYQVQDIFDEDGFKIDHKVLGESFTNVVSSIDLNKVIKDCQILS